MCPKVLAVKKFLSDQDFDCLKQPSSLNIGQTHGVLYSWVSFGLIMHILIPQQLGYRPLLANFSDIFFQLFWSKISHQFLTTFFRSFWRHFFPKKIPNIYICGVFGNVSLCPIRVHQLFSPITLIRASLPPLLIRVTYQYTEDVPTVAQFRQ